MAWPGYVGRAAAITAPLRRTPVFCPAMTIRPARPADAQAIAHIHIATWQRAYQHILPAAYLAALSMEERQAMWEQALKNGPTHTLVIEEQGQVAGFSSIGQSRDEGATASDFEIWAIYLHPQYWARGLGRALWQASKDYAVTHAATSISLWVFADNARALRFYQKVGFQVEADKPQTFEMGGVQVQELRCVQRLD